MVVTYTNMIRNPSAETNATNWQASQSGSTITRQTTDFLYGVASLRTVTDSTQSLQGPLYTTNQIAALQGQTWTASAYVKGASGTVRLQLKERNAAGSAITSTNSSNVTLSSSWQRVSATYTLPSATAAFVTFDVVTPTNQTITFYVDGAMLTQTATLVPYIDGTQPGCVWTGTEHASTSVFTNVVPAVSAGADVALIEGETFTRSGSFTDATGTSWTATVNYGEGAGAIPLTLTGLNFTLSNVYEAAGVYTVTVAVTDNYGDIGTDTVQVTVSANAAPVVSAGVDVALTTGDTFTRSGSFSDATGSSWTATVNYGEGAGAGVLNLTGTTFSLSNVYETAGVYTVTVAVTDNFSGVGQDTVTVTVTDPVVEDDAREIRNRKIAAAIAMGAV